MSHPRLLPIPSVAAALGISKRMTWKLVSSGELTVVRLGRRVLVAEDDLTEFVDRCR